MAPVKVESTVGSDGVLTLRVPLGPGEAGSRVVVTIEPATAPATTAAGTAGGTTDWHEFVEQTYGSCAGLGLERQEQGRLADRETVD